jgi:broad specificity phosphatase PhoE
MMLNRSSIVCIRHANVVAEWNGRFIGCQDAELSVDGIHAAERLRPVSHQWSSAAVFSSPLRRAKQTASILFPDSAVTIDDGLSERCLGEWEGKQKSEMRRDFPELFLRSGRLNPQFTPPGGEPIVDFVTRVQRMMSRLVLTPVVLVTHNGVISVLRFLANQSPLDVAFAENVDFLTPTIFEMERTANYSELHRNDG